MKRKKIITIALIALIIISIIFIIRPFSTQRASGDKGLKQTASDDQTGNSSVQTNSNGDVVFPVTAAIVRKGNLVAWVNTSGYAYALQDYEIKPNVSGQVVQLEAHNGKKVNKGDLLFKLDDAESKLEVERYKNALLKAQIEYDLQKSTPFAGNIDETKYKHKLDSLKIVLDSSNKLFDEHKISHDDLNRIKRDYETLLTLTKANREDVIATMSGLSNAIADYDKAKLNLSYTKLSAPINGLVADCNISKGSYVNSGSLCMRVIDMSNIKMQCEVTESDIVNIHTGDPVEAEFIALPGKKFQGKVIEVNPYIDLEKRTAKVTVLLSNPELLIKPGMFASVKIGTSIFSNVILIPHSALLVRENRTLVFTVEGGLAQWKYVTTGKNNDQYYIVKDGLNAGDTLIVGGNYNLAHQSKVSITAMTKY